ncbi:protein indeterminate-domain 14-like [Henckelia pumila]|uniref:protein indeterminate-domain 14-like n=1 Tax=Henckelia pumila TaxID=405737 RepID=UPI003C6E877A
MLRNSDNHSPPPEPENGISISKRKRRPAGTPDPDAEVVSLSPKTLLESDRYVCEICNQGFQRDQNLQMHRRRHKVPWKLLKRETPMARKRVYVCPEPSCLHHDPCHALGDLVGIKKHFRRKHSNQKQWVCDKCSKGYAVQSDYKAHLKTCGTRGHSCDCGRVFSRVESFIEHQDACSMGQLRSESHPLQPPRPPRLVAACLSRTASSPSPSSDTNLSVAPRPSSSSALPRQIDPIFFTNFADTSPASRYPNLEFHLLSKKLDEDQSTQLQLSIGSSSEMGGRTDADGRRTTFNHRSSPRGGSSSTTCDKLPFATAAAVAAPAERLKEVAQEQLRIAVAEKAYADEARQEAKRQIELAEQQFAEAKRIRQQAIGELQKAHALKEHATEQVNSIMLQITCNSCKQKFQQSHAASSSWPPLLPFAEASSSSCENSLGMSNISAALREWEFNKINDRN